MKLVSLLPGPVEFNREKIYDPPNSESTRRLSVAIPHSVNGFIAGKERSGLSNVVYNFDFPETATFKGKMTNESHSFIGIQSSDFLKEQITLLRPRTAYSVDQVSNGKFDMRAFMYVLGAAFMGGSAGVKMEYLTRPSQFSTPDTGWSVPDTGKVILGPSLVSNVNQFVTLLALAGEAGVSHAFLLTDKVFGLSGEVMTGRYLARFAFKIALNILSTAMACACYGSHRMAFEAGKMSIATLNAHCDEGGWIRRLLTSPSYPKPCGIVAGMGKEFTSYPLQEYIPLDQTLRVCIGELLACVGLIPVADYLLNGELSVYTKGTDEPGRVGSFGPLMGDIYDVMHKWRDLICDEENVFQDAHSDVGVFDTYMRANRVDRHLEHDAITPWWWVEFSPLLTTKYDGVFTPATHGEVKKLPLFRHQEIYHNSTSTDSSGRLAPGSSMFVERKRGGIRDEGASYLLSSRYSPDNGLTQWRLSENPLDGAPAPSLMFSGEGPEIAAMRWTTPHNPMPHPWEMYADKETVFFQSSLSPWYDVSPKDVMESKVESRFGLFKIVTTDMTDEKICHKFVPPFLKLRLTRSNVFARPIKALELRRVLNTTNTSTQPTPSEGDVLDEPGEQKNLVEAKPPDLSEPPTETASVVLADTGVKPTVKLKKPTNDPGEQKSKGDY
jgi:hypothetical protein